MLGLDALESFPNALPPRAEQLWRVDHFAADIPFTNPMFVPVEEPSPDIGLIHHSIALVAARHQALRTRLTLKDGRPLQIVEEWKSTRLELTPVLRRDLAQDRPDAPDNPVSRFTKATMDLYAQDTFRAQAFRDEHGQVTLGFLAHGYFSDAWSSQLLLKEFREAHAALREKRHLSLPAPPAQYGDYALAQRRSLERDLASHLAYWQGKLAGSPPTHLPSDRRTETGRRGRSYFFIGREVIEPLVALARHERVSLTLLLLAAYQVALGRWSGRREILSAAYTADRVKSRFQDTIGFLVANLPVCARLEPRQGFASFLAALARDFYGSYPHRELSCELYEAIFEPPKPFCPAVFNFLPLEKRFCASELLSLPAFDGTVRGPDGPKPAIYRQLYLGLAQYPNGLLGKLFYDADLFTPAGAESFVPHFRAVLAGIANGHTVTVEALM
ncbi:MAG: condensation domain-containing protein [Rhizomicrobium sp.]